MPLFHSSQLESRKGLEAGQAAHKGYVNLNSIANAISNANHNSSKTGIIFAGSVAGGASPANPPTPEGGGVWGKNKLCVDNQYSRA